LEIFSAVAFRFELRIVTKEAAVFLGIWAYDGVYISKLSNKGD